MTLLSSKYLSIPVMKGTSSTHLRPIAVPSAPQSGSLVVFTVTSHLALRPSSVMSPKSGAFPSMAQISGMPEPLRFVLIPRTEFPKFTADDSAQATYVPGSGALPTSSR